jgi:HD superfamily phosphohydrolase
MSSIIYYDNDIKLQYRDLVCTDKDTSFLNKYLELPVLKRLGHIHQFCGCDNTNIHDSIISEYTRLDHSVIVAKMTYHFTNNKTQAVAALFHDVLTPAFAHTNDFRKGDAKNQKSSETNYSLQFIADILQSLIDEKIITEEDIHKNLSEDDIENIILNSRLKEVWKKFNDSQNIIRCNKKPGDLYYFSSKTEVKKRIVDPLCLYNGNIYRLSEISNVFNSKLQEYYSFKDSKYCYVKGIKKF